MGIKLGAGKEFKGGSGKNMSELEINLSKLQDGGKAKLRLIGEIEPNFRFWVGTRDGKKKPILTPFFNKDTENFDPGDPLLGNAQKEFFYTVNCIDRSDGKVKILILKTTVYRYLYSLANDPDYGDCTDPDSGFDLNIIKERTGPQPQNVKYNVSPSLKMTPLTDDEKVLELHNLGELYCPKSEGEYITWIKENTTILDREIDGDSGHGTEDDVPF